MFLLQKKNFLYLFLIVFMVGVGYTKIIINLEQVDANSTPAIDSVYISTTTNGLYDDYPGGLILPNTGSTKTIHINGVVSDADGATEIDNVSSVFYRSGVTNAQNCTQDNNNCYKNTDCTLSDLATTTKKYNCDISFEYYIDATDESGRYSSDNWVTYVKVKDTSSASSTNSTVTKEIASILSLDIPSGIDFGSFSLGYETVQLNNHEMTIGQQGNSEADIMVSGTDMPCSAIGVIPKENQKWSLTDVGYNHQDAISLTDTPTLVDIFIGYRDDDATNVTKTLYWNIGIATSSLKGTCLGTSTFSVVAH